jgi:hypothetical protein
MLNIIQLGLTFSNPTGSLAPGICTWQFNFQFNVKYVGVTHPTHTEREREIEREREREREREIERERD